MSAHTIVTGNLGDTPAIKFTPSGTAALDLSIACTPRRKDKTTGEWVDDGDPVWLRTAFFGADAERIAEMSLQRGAKVTVEGTLRRRVYEKRDGGVGESLEIVGAKFLGVVPKGRRSDAPNRAQAASSGAQGGGPVSSSGAWSAWPSQTQGAFTDQYPTEAPF